MNFMDYESLPFGEELSEGKPKDIEVIKEISKNSCE